MEPDNGTRNGEAVERCSLGRASISDAVGPTGGHSGLVDDPGAAVGRPGACGGPRGAAVVAAVGDFLKRRKAGRVPHCVPRRARAALNATDTPQDVQDGQGTCSIAAPASTDGQDRPELPTGEPASLGDALDADAEADAKEVDHG